MHLHEHALQTGTFEGIDNMIGIDTYCVVIGGVGVGYTIMYQLHQTVLDWLAVRKMIKDERKRIDQSE